MNLLFFCLPETHETHTYRVELSLRSPIRARATKQNHLDSSGLFSISVDIKVGLYRGTSQDPLLVLLVFIKSGVQLLEEFNKLLVVQPFVTPRPKEPMSKPVVAARKYTHGRRSAWYEAPRAPPGGIPYKAVRPPTPPEGNPY